MDRPQGLGLTPARSEGSQGDGLDVAGLVTREE